MFKMTHPFQNVKPKAYDKGHYHTVFPCPDLERQALEALVLEKFRVGHLNKDELAQLLGLDGGDQIDGFLKAHDVFEPYTLDDLERERRIFDELGL